MKRVVAIALAGVLLLTGCASNTTVSPTTEKVTEEVVVAPTEDNVVTEPAGQAEDTADDGLIHVVVGDDEVPDDEDYVYEPEFNSLNDEELMTYVEDAIYSELVSTLNSDEYYIENVSAVYISQEYIDELTYNSKSNVYFGYTLEEIDAQFQGTRYVFTLGEDGDTVVQPFEAYDDTYEQIIKNVAIGTGVILVCVTVSVVTAGAGAPAVSLIFATAAKTGTIMALSSGAIGGVSAGVVTGAKCTPLAGSNAPLPRGFKCTPSGMHPLRRDCINGPKMSSSKLPRFLLRFDYVSWPRYATLCAILPFWPEFCKMRYLSGGLANWRKLEHFDEVLEEENADKSFIRLPRQHLP